MNTSDSSGHNLVTETVLDHVQVKVFGFNPYEVTQLIHIQHQENQVFFLVGNIFVTCISIIIIETILLIEGSANRCCMQVVCSKVTALKLHKLYSRYGRKSCASLNINPS